MSKRSSRVKRRAAKRKKEAQAVREKAYITVREAAEEIEVTSQCIREWIDTRHGGLTAKVFGRKTLRIAVADWERFKAGRPTYGAPGPGSGNVAVPA